MYKISTAYQNNYNIMYTKRNKYKYLKWNNNINNVLVRINPVSHKHINIVYDVSKQNHQSLFNPIPQYGSRLPTITCEDPRIHLVRNKLAIVGTANRFHYVMIYIYSVHLISIHLIIVYDYKWNSCIRIIHRSVSIQDNFYLR